MRIIALRVLVSRGERIEQENKKFFFGEKSVDRAMGFAYSTQLADWKR